MVLVNVFTLRGLFLGCCCNFLIKISIDSELACASDSEFFLGKRKIFLFFLSFAFLVFFLPASDNHYKAGRGISVWWCNESFDRIDLG